MACNCNNTDSTDKTTPCNGCVGCSQKCHEVVDTFAEVDQFRNAFVTVREENATYHVDEVGNAIAVSRNPVFDNEYIPTAGDYKNVIVYNFTAEEGYVFNPSGAYMIIPLLNPNSSPGSLES